MTTSPRTPAGSPPATTTYAVRTPEDLLALLPVVLGFEPEESVCLLGFPAPPRGQRRPAPGRGAPPGEGRCFSARVDLPPGPDRDDPDAGHTAALVDQLVGPVREHRLPRAVLVVHSARLDLAAAVGGRLLSALAVGAPATEVLGVLLADGRRWWALPDGAPPAPGVPYDVRHHPLRLQAVVDGRVTHGSRAALDATLEPDPAAVARVVGALATPAPAPAADGGDERDAAFVGRVVGAAVTATGGPGAAALDDATAARLLCAVQGAAGREAACRTLTRATAVAHTALWSDLVRRAPAGLRGTAAVLLALSAWVRGDGALAWCALDRTEPDGPAAALADLVASALERAVPPEVWERGVA